jgi:hypothetical protein
MSCNQNTSDKTVVSQFDLLKDYPDFQTKMGEKDTINIWVAIPTCFPPISVEKLNITKKDKSITVVTTYIDDIQNLERFAEQSFVTTVSENDTVWKFGKLLSDNSFRTKINSNKKRAVIRLTYKSQKLYFFTKDIADHNRFILEYTNTMKKINPKTRMYVEEIEIID